MNKVCLIIMFVAGIFVGFVSGVRYSHGPELKACELMASNMLKQAQKAENSFDECMTAMNEVGQRYEEMRISAAKYRDGWKECIDALKESDGIRMGCVDSLNTCLSRCP